MFSQLFKDHTANLSIILLWARFAERALMEKHAANYAYRYAHSIQVFWGCRWCHLVFLDVALSGVIVQVGGRCPRGKRTHVHRLQIWDPARVSQPSTEQTAALQGHWGQRKVKDKDKGEGGRTHKALHVRAGRHLWSMHRMIFLH